MSSNGSAWDCHVHVFEASARRREGHYQPVDRPLAEIEAAAEGQGVHHLVLVQPSVYGTDNSVMLRALRVDPGRHRGVVVVEDGVGDRELDAMHACGVRGVRLNLVSPVGDGDPSRVNAIAPRLKARGWHVQWYVAPQQLPQVAALHRDSGVTCVLDHLAGFAPHIGDGNSAWEALRALSAQGAWIKLSGWYRLNTREPYSEVLPNVRRIAELFEERMVWGSDWPHTEFAPDAMPSYASTWRPVPEALGQRAADAVRAGIPTIYL